MVALSHRPLVLVSFTLGKFNTLHVEAFFLAFLSPFAPSSTLGLNTAVTLLCTLLNHNYQITEHVPSPEKYINNLLVWLDYAS